MEEAGEAQVDIIIPLSLNKRRNITICLEQKEKRVSFSTDMSIRVSISMILLILNQYCVTGRRRRKRVLAFRSSLPYNCTAAEA
jgi:hypothetical protein